ncbi:hypothetical protein NSZ01_37040 [Nocardioides szechwanensis]|nr:hypothetical protein NSZ01_37040 [Nocardioides szechwanensis]
MESGGGKVGYWLMSTTLPGQPVTLLRVRWAPAKNLAPQPGAADVGCPDDDGTYGSRHH